MPRKIKRFGPKTGQDLRKQKIATIRIKFGVHPGNPGWNQAVRAKYAGSA